MGGTSLALPRRQRNAALFARVFRGRAIDVGGDPDPLQTNDAWPDLKDIIVWDLPNDGHNLRQFADDSFDVVYSSHCIEHMKDPANAVREWWRVIRPGGHLVVVAPDATLYEKDKWPSEYNPGHLHRFSTKMWPRAGTFTAFDLFSWVYGESRLVSLQWLADGYDYARAHLDQTATGDCECGIEWIIEKLT